MKKYTFVLLSCLILTDCSNLLLNKKQLVIPKASLSGLLFPYVTSTPSEIQLNYDPNTGGVLNSSNMNLILPVDANSQKFTIVGKPLNEIPMIDDPDLKSAGIAYEFSPHGTEFDFTKLPTLTFKYDPAILSTQGIVEENVKIYYYDEELQTYVAVGGTVDTTKKTVSVPLEHFSIYLAAAQAQKPTNTIPAVGAPTCLPACGAANTRAGAPIYVRSVVTDPDTNGSLVDVSLYYRVVGSPTYTKIQMAIDPAQPPVQDRYAAIIPAASVTNAGIDFYVEAIDNLGGIRTRAPIVRTPSTSICSVTNPAPFTIVSGFKRLITLAGTAGATCPSATAVTNIIAESYSISNGLASTLSAGSNGVLFEAKTSGTGILTANVGSFTTNTNVTVKNGGLSSIQILDENSLPISGTLGISPNYNYSFDVIGKDAYNNQILILPNWSLTGAIGSFTTITSGILNTTGGSGTGTVTATLGSKSQTINVLVANVGPPISGILAIPGINSITISWDSVPGANTYNLYYTADGSIPSKSSGVKVANISSPFTHTPVISGPTYKYVLTSASAGPPGPPNGYESAESVVFSAIALSSSAPLSPSIGVAIGTISQQFNGTYNFNSVLENTIGLPVTFTVKNSGASTLQYFGVQAANIYGANADQFQLTQPLFPVLPGQSSNFIIQFSPTSGGIKTAELAIVCNDPVTPYFRLNLTGLATCAGDGIEDVANWNKKIDGNLGKDELADIGIDSSGSIYLVGIGENIVSATSGPDWWLKKYSASGIEVTAGWNKKINGGTDSAPLSVSIDSANNIYVVGYGQALVSASSGLDAWIKKFTSAGTEITTGWDKKIDLGSVGKAMDAIVDSAGNLYVIGQGSRLVSPTSGQDWWIKKFSPTGVEDTTNWNKVFDGGSDAIPYSITLDAAGNIYVAGFGNNLVSTNSGQDWWIKKFSATGTEDTTNWNKFYDSGIAGGIASDIAVDNVGDIYVTGIGYTNGISQMWIKKFSPSGLEDSVNWDKKISAPVVGAGGFGIEFDSSNKVFVTGYGFNLISSSSGIDWWTKKFLSTGIEDVTNWNKMIDNGADDFGFKIKRDTLGNMYNIGTSGNLISPNSGHDWWIKKFQASACY